MLRQSKLADVGLDLPNPLGINEQGMSANTITASSLSSATLCFVFLSSLPGSKIEKKVPQITVEASVYFFHLSFFSLFFNHIPVPPGTKIALMPMKDSWAGIIAEGLHCSVASIPLSFISAEVWGQLSSLSQDFTMVKWEVTSPQPPHSLAPS